MIIDRKSKNIEEMCSTAIRNGMIGLSRILPEINILISPILYTAINIQETKSYAGLSNVKTSDLGCWNTFLYVNGRTEQLHTEHDCAYTYITVPKQIRNEGTPLHNKPLFIFKFSDTQHLVLPLNDNISFAYNGQFITHRQAFMPSMNNNDNLFFNISSYGNEKIFNHLRRTFEREMNNKT